MQSLNQFFGANAYRYDEVGGEFRNRSLTFHNQKNLVCAQAMGLNLIFSRLNVILTLALPQFMVVEDKQHKGYFKGVFRAKHLNTEGKSVEVFCREFMQKVRDAQPNYPVSGYQIMSDPELINAARQSDPLLDRELRSLENLSMAPLNLTPEQSVVFQMLKEGFRWAYVADKKSPALQNILKPLHLGEIAVGIADFESLQNPSLEQISNSKIVTAALRLFCEGYGTSFFQQFPLIANPEQRKWGQDNISLAGRLKLKVESSPK